MTERGAAELRRALGASSAAALVVGTIIGSGIFLVPKDMTEAVGSAPLVFLVWVVGGLLSLCGALAYAELAAAMPEAGGEYVYLREAYGPLWGFLYGWTQTWVAKSGSVATLATAFFVYLANFHPQLEAVCWRIPYPIGPGGGPLEIRWGQFFAAVVVLVLAAVNYLGVRFGGGVQVAVTAVKIGLLAAIVAIGLTSEAGNAANFTSTAAGMGGWAGFFAALVAALWAYDGWNNVSMVASEIRRPQRNLPLALIAGTLAVMVIYLLTNAAYFYVLPAGVVASSDRVAAEMMRRIWGAAGADAVSLAAMVSIFAALNGSILSGSRVPYAMARDGYFFRPLARIHPARRTPSVSLWVLSLWACVLIFTGRYRELFTYVIFASWIFYGMTAAAVIVLRRKNPQMERPYRTVGYPWLPLLFTICAASIVLSTLLHSPRESAIGLGLILGGLPFYFVWSKQSHSRD
ncbi:MAG: amino acid permease [Bryobacterales bacterium]|nr:amino acid permease [Bryobacteraceae bacterium]MDW8355441.1 amino acid permease [Bryobacterales bacterium]